MIAAMQDAAYSILRKAESYEWSLQGFGMLRCYLGASRRVRLHVWDDRYAVPNVSLIHDHPWAFESTILSGTVRNVRFYEHSSGRPTHHAQVILCGPGGCALERLADVRLSVRDDCTYRAPDDYGQDATWLHASYPSRGAVTVIERHFGRGDTERARVLFPVGTSWVSAEPRLATPGEVADICGHALAVWGK